MTAHSLSHQVATELVVAPEKEHSLDIATNHGDQEPGVSLEVIDRKAERRLLHKFDFYVVIPLGLFYMLAILDRSNLGNANIAGMPTDIGLVGNQFGTATTLLYATYVPFEAPVAVIVRKIGPKYLISAIALCWGLSTLGMAFITDYKGLYVCRLLMGMFEAGLIPASEVYLALVFNRAERGRRMSLFYVFSCLASAFGGLLAYGLTQIQNTGWFTGWRWLFAVEAALTIVMVPFFFAAFPKSPTDAWFLTPAEKGIMRARYDADPYWSYDEEFSWSEVMKIWADPKFYAFFIYQFSVDLTQFGFTSFLPAITTGLGYESYHANLMTVPIYFVALVFFVLCAFASDHFRMRGPFLAGPLVIQIVGFALLIAVDNLKVRFFGCFLIAMGLYPTAALSMMWLQDNVAGFYKRSAMLGIAVTFANTAGVVVGQIFTTQSSPRYIMGLSICMGFSGLALAIAVGLMVSFHIVNKRRSKLVRDAAAAGTPLPSQPERGDYDVHYRYQL